MNIENNKEAEPALKTGSIVATVAGVLSLVVFLFPDLLTERQISLILVLTSVAIPIITAIITRGKVWSPKSVQEAVDKVVVEVLRPKKSVDDK